jgi:formylglycine-generating enzyme required for sulfatase activity
MPPLFTEPAMNRNTTLPFLLPACCALATFLEACIPPAKDGGKTADTGDGPSPEGNSSGDCVDGEDNDQDGLTDCADEGCTSSADCADPTEDADADGIPADQDCDDGDPTSTTFADDPDCDGVLTADDCDDADAASTARLEDGDCDAVLAVDDCDDHDPASTVRDEDGDCDGVLTTDDCDDADAASTTRAEDGDCDAVLTDEDCDDSDPSIGRTIEGDDDCDGVADDPAMGRPAQFVDIASGIEFKLIPAGDFEIGCTPGQSDCRSNELPVMPVTITRDYYMGGTEVTQEQFELMMGYNPSYFGGCPTCPVESITWHEAAQLANAMSAAAGLAECYACSGREEGARCTAVEDLPACAGYRMPTAAEWEGAARCGEDLPYVGSTDVNAVAWHSGNAGGATNPVARLTSNACRLADMSGNLFEWTHDWHAGDYYTSIGRVDPVGPTTGEYRECRGGNWVREARYHGTSDRAFAAPDLRYDDAGIRLARTAP